MLLEEGENGRLGHCTLLRLQSVKFSTDRLPEFPFKNAP